MELKELLTKPNGANYYLADLHIHTPSDKSKNYQMKGEQKLLSDENWCRQYVRKIINEAYKKKINIIGITDHNSADWIDYFNEEVKNLNPQNEQNKLIIFPGFEINTNTGSGVHIICLFNPGTPKSKLDEYLSALFDASERFDSKGYPKLAKKSCNEVINFIQENGGICIGAHALSSNGILSSSYGQQPRAEAFTNPKLLVVEIPGARSKLTGFAKNAIEGLDPHYKRERSIATINSSDPDSLDKIGSRTTYIKMSSITIEGLREAFLDWESRIRFKEELEKEKYAVIIGARWEGGGCFLDDQMIHFNKNLNAIIGGKGTGKSTIIETLRYVFNQSPESPNAERAYQDIIREVFKSGSTLQVLVYSKQLDRHYLVERSYPGQPVLKSIDEELLKKENLIKEKEISNLTVESILIPEIYGQKEIYDISDDPSFQLKLVDRFLDEKFTQLKTEETNLLKQLKTNKADLINTLESLDKIEENNKELLEIREKKQKYIGLGIQERLKTQRSYEKEKSLLEKAIRKIDDLRNNLMDFFDTLDMDITFLSDRAIEGLPNKELLKKGKERLISLFSFLESKRTEIKDTIAKTNINLTGIKTEWEPLYNEQQEEYQKIIDNLRKEGIPLDPEEFMKLERRENLLKSIVSDKDKYSKMKEELEAGRRRLLDRLNKIRLDQFKKRKEVEKRINEKLKGTLKIDVKYATKRDDFIKKLVGYSSRENRIMKEPIKRMVEDDKFNVRLFVDILRKGEQELINNFDLTPGTASSLYRAIPIEDYYDFETYDFDPETQIRLYIGPSEVQIYERSDDLFKSTGHLSKGQKSTAILTLVLLESDRPLIIDQPEDDLDNRFVVDDVVKKLRAEKEKRQFIIATHNANITISADAELILALDADDKHGWEQTSGSIDDQKVKGAVERIIEGGKDVFLLRKEKYGF
ncbi:MAG: AAA family ATPase [Candidatus Cloacimonetes bacterium]|nr:AAA family ATPase [Candidatus Cloacimonadota bacterium]MBL7086516.1 AAA family ATPase [Candidatus Cloacimonadota bacterium]